MPIVDREDLKNYVELPLLGICEELYDKGIVTVASSANKQDIDSGYCSLLINFESLSKENKDIVQSIATCILTTPEEEEKKAYFSYFDEQNKSRQIWITPDTKGGHGGYGRRLQIMIQANSQSTALEIQSSFKQVTDLFVDQSGIM
ncbi:MAG: hypothetical protein WCP03_01400 [Candidatus Saccharibacteria bacterium]